MEFYIDGVLVDSPEGWDETRASRIFDHDSAVNALTFDQEYTWTGSVYQLLYGRYRSGLVCDLLGVEVKLRGRSIVQGVVFLTDCVFNESTASVRVKVRDDGFSARIQNNLSVPIQIFGDESKNGETIDLLTPQNVLMFNQQTGGPLVGITGRPLYTVHDAMKFCVQWMTDGNVDFRSDYFLSGDGSADFVTSGANLKSEEGTEVLGPIITFRDLFATYRILRNVGVAFERDGGRPVVRVEHISYFQEAAANPIQCANAISVEMEFVQELLYSHIDIGSETTEETECNGGCGAFVNTRWFGFKREAFGIGGTCNIDKPFGLFQQGRVVIDGNTINSVLLEGGDKFDESLICVHVDTTTMQATTGDPLNIGQYWYNVPYINAEVIGRYQDYISGNIDTFTLVSDLNLFLCSGSDPIGRFQPSVDYTQTLSTLPTYTTFPAPGGPIVWANDTAFIQNAGSTVPRIQAGFQCFDIGNRYNDSTGRYVAEFDGALRFNVQFALEASSGSPSGTLNIRVAMDRYDAGGNLIGTTTFPAVNDTVINLTTLQSSPIVDTGFVAANAGDGFEFRIEAGASAGFPFTTDLLILEGWIELTETRNVVKVQQTNNGTRRLGVRRTFDYPLTDPDTDALLTDTRRQVRVTGRATDATGFVEKLEVNLHTNTANVSIISNA
jgi:hypothetical protein